MLDHKHVSRQIQDQLVPEAVPDFSLVDPRNPSGPDKIRKYPVFMKPVKSCMSMHARRIKNEFEMERFAKSAVLPKGFVRPFEDMLRAYGNVEFDAHFLLAEGIAEGHQVSLEGYAFEDEIHVLGILDAVMFPGTQSFSRFDYPSRLPEQVKDRMIDIAKRLMHGVAYNFAMFNIEMIYDQAADRVFIVEVNPKIATQFTDLFEKVDGMSTYAVLLELALGERPSIEKGKGTYDLAASCVLRTFQNQRVIKAPSQEEIDSVLKSFPESRVQIYAEPGKLLSEQMQDTESFRYGLIHLGAMSSEEIEENFQTAQKMLSFEFEPVNENAIGAGSHR